MSLDDAPSTDPKFKNADVDFQEVYHDGCSAALGMMLIFCAEIKRDNGTTVKGLAA
jgi:hypothetical protein